MKKIVASLIILAILSSCVPENRKNVYTTNEVGKNTIVSFGKILSLREVKIEDVNNGGGALAGAAAGGLGGSAIGSGRGSVIAIVAGAVIGGVAGAAAESALKEQKGIEYIIRFEALDLTKSIVQALPKDELPVAIGQCAMVQQTGDFQRVQVAPDAKLCDVEDDSTTKRSKSLYHKKKKKVKADDDE